MIFGTGIDQIETRRVSRKMAGDPGFKEVLFTRDEIAYCDGKAHASEHYAARYAAKEAFFKALGTGWRDGLKFTEVEIRHNDLGKPEIALSGTAMKMAEERNCGAIHVSLSHLKETASAIVIIELK